MYSIIILVCSKCSVFVDIEDEAHAILGCKINEILRKTFKIAMDYFYIEW
jgi:hypothetical protein